MNLLRGDRRPPTAVFGQSLRIVRLITVHPTDHRWVIQAPKGEFVLLTNKPNPRVLKSVQLLPRWPFPKAHISVESSLSISFGIRRILQPNGNWKEARL